MESLLRRCKWIGRNSSDSARAIGNVWGLRPLSEWDTCFYEEQIFERLQLNTVVLTSAPINNACKWWPLKEKKSLLDVELTRLGLRFVPVFWMCMCICNIFIFYFYAYFFFICVYVCIHSYIFLPTSFLKCTLLTFNINFCVLLYLCFLIKPSLKPPIVPSAIGMHRRQTD